MNGVGDVAVWEVLEGEEVWADWAGELGRAGLFPAEGLARGEREGEREFRFGEIEWHPTEKEGFCGFFGGCWRGRWGWGWRRRRRRGGVCRGRQFLHHWSKQRVENCERANLGNLIK